MHRYEADVAALAVVMREHGYGLRHLVERALVERDAAELEHLREILRGEFEFMTDWRAKLQQSYPGAHDAAETADLVAERLGELTPALEACGRLMAAAGIAPPATNRPQN